MSGHNKSWFPFSVTTKDWRMLEYENQLVDQMVTDPTERNVIGNVIQLALSLDATDNAVEARVANPPDVPYYIIHLMYHRNMRIGIREMSVVQSIDLHRICDMYCCMDHEENKFAFIIHVKRGAFIVKPQTDILVHIKHAAIFMPDPHGSDSLAGTAVKRRRVTSAATPPPNRTRGMTAPIKPWPNQG